MSSRIELWQWGPFSCAKWLPASGVTWRDWGVRKLNSGGPWRWTFSRWALDIGPYTLRIEV